MQVIKSALIKADVQRSSFATHCDIYFPQGDRMGSDAAFVRLLWPLVNGRLRVNADRLNKACAAELKSRRERQRRLPARKFKHQTRIYDVTL